MNPYQRLVSEVDSLIYDKATKESDGWHLSIDDLDDDELGELVALCLENNDRDTSECFHQPDQYAKDDEITCLLLTMLKNNTCDSKEDLGDAIRKQSIKSFSKYLQEMIDDRCGWCYQDFIDSRGFDE